MSRRSLRCTGMPVDTFVVYTSPFYPASLWFHLFRSGDTSNAVALIITFADLYPPRSRLSRQDGFWGWHQNGLPVLVHPDKDAYQVKSRIHTPKDGPEAFLLSPVRDEARWDKIRKVLLTLASSPLALEATCIRKDIPEDLVRL